MKSNVNKLIIMVWCFCLAGFALANDARDIAVQESEYLQKGRDSLTARMSAEINGVTAGDSRILSVTIPEGEEGSEEYRTLITFSVSGSSYCSEISWGLGALDNFGCSSATYDLGTGTYEVWLGDTYGDGWNGGSMTVSVGGATLATYYGPSSGCESDDSSSPCWEVESLVLTECDDAAACNGGGIGDCYYAPANAYCSGSCFEGYPADCNGDCGGSAIADCTGVCGGTTLDTDFVCSSENIENGPSPAGATSGVLYDDGGPTSDYSDYSNDVYLIDVGTGVVSIDVVSLDLENCCDTLWLCDGDSSPNYSPWYGSGDCTRVTSDVTTWASSSSTATVLFESDSSVNYGGFQLAWSQAFPGCTDSTACAGYDSSATLNDGSCSYNDALGVCGGSCAADTDSDNLCDDVDDCVGSYDSCGICNGADASQDCAGTCSGTLEQGTFTLDISYADGNTQEEVYALSASGSNWSVSNCSNYSGDGSMDTAVSFSADCDLTSNFWAGGVSLTLSVSDLAAGLGSINLSGTGFSATLDGTVDLVNSTGNTLTGDTSAATVGGALADECGNCDFDPSNDCVQDCAGQWGGTASLDGCGLCNGGNASQDCLGVCSGTLSDGVFQLDISYASDDTANENELYALTASGSNWSVSNCTNFNASSGSELTFSADCDLTSDFWVGAVSMSLSVSDQAAGTGSITLTGSGFSVTLDGSTDADNSTALTLVGSTSAASLGGAVVDSCDVCDGDGSSCVVGCMDSTACNYNPGAGVPGDCFTLDSCGVCGGADASLDCGGDCFGSFSAGTFALTPNDDMTDWTLQASTADESSAGWWSIGNCSNFALGGGGVVGGPDEGPLTFTADCEVISASYVGGVSLTLGVSDIADDGSATGSITLSSADFNVVATGSVADSATFPTLSGSVDAFAASAASDLDSDGLCDDVDADDDGDGLEPTTDGITGDCDDTDATVGLCTYDSCDDWGGQGCLWQDGTVALWWEGWWNCPQNGGQVCGLAEVNFEVDTNGSAEAENVDLIGMFGPYNGWNPTFDIYSDADGDGVYSLTLYLDQGDLEYKLFGNADASSQENLLDFGTTVQGSDQWGDYYEYLNGSCATVTDYYSYANRLLTITADDINTSQTVSACYGSCNETCLSGCTDPVSCNYDADDNLDENLAGQINYDSDDGSCLVSDNCGFCGGGDANYDCAGQCSGSLSDGTLLEVPGVSLSGSADDNSWSLSDCSVSSSTVTDVNAFVQNVVTNYDCVLSSSVFEGSTAVTTDQNIFSGSASTPAGFLFNISLSGGTQFNLSTTSLISGYGDTGISGTLSSATDAADGFPSVFGLVGTGVDNIGTDCNAECGGSAFVDDCGVCSGGSTVFSAGSFTLEPNTAGDDWSLTASADDGSWSLGNCSNYDGSGAPDDNLAFTADCDLSSVTYTGSVAITLALSDVADDGSATGSVSISSASFNATASGSVADSSTFPTLNGSLDTFGEFPNEDNLGCGCFNDAPLAYYIDSDGDGLGENGTDSVLYCLPTDDCANVNGGCTEPTVPHSVVPGTPDSCSDTDNGAYDAYWYGCDYYAYYTSWCGNYDDSDFDSASMCCGCGGGQDVPGTPDSYALEWSLNDTDADDACTSNVHDCNNVCDGPGSTATADGSCCVSGGVDCNGLCDSALSFTGVDGAGTDCNGICGGSAQVLDFGWNSGSWDSETSWSVTAPGATEPLASDADGGTPGYSMPADGCFLTDVVYEVSICDTYGDGWNGASLSIGSEDYTIYAYLNSNECLTTSFSLDGDGGCNVATADNFNADADWDNGTCLFPATAPSGLTVSGEDQPDDYPESIGFRVSWDEVPNAERYVLAWWDETPQPVTGDECDYYGSAGVIDCDLNCSAQSWLGNGGCSLSLNCEVLDWDGEDCCEYNGAWQTDDSTALCYEEPPLTCSAGETLVTMNSGYCCSGEHSFEIQDNSDDSILLFGSGDAYEGCVTLPASWRVEMMDSYGDGWDGATITIGDTTYGSSFTSGDLECTNSDGSSCTPALVVGDSCTASCYYYSWWSGGYYYNCSGVVDCSGDCTDTGTQYSWSNDGYCDSIFDCAELSWDGGDCTPSMAGQDNDYDINYETIESRIDHYTKIISTIEQYKGSVDINSDEFKKANAKQDQFNNTLLTFKEKQTPQFAEIQGMFEPLETRDPIGWVVLSSNAAASGYFSSGYDYGFDREFSVATVTNQGQGDWATSVTGTTPVLPVPSDFTLVAGPQVFDDYEFVNLSWQYPTFEYDPYASCAGNLAYISDGYCDSINNNPDCGWDGGDCCEDTCVTDSAPTGTTQYDCDGDGAQNDTNNDGCWDACYDPSTACGNGIPTCNDDYQFGVLVGQCVNYSNSIQIFWNNGCSGSITMDGATLIFDTSSTLPPYNVTGLDPNTRYDFEFIVDDVVVASDSATSSSEDCDAEVEFCGGTLSWISDGYCDSSNNNADCAYDGGDCCPGDCVDGAYSCAFYGGDCDDCINPNSADNATGGTCDVPDPVVGDACVIPGYWYDYPGTIDCNLNCTDNYYLGGGYCTSGFNCAYFDWDQEACCEANGLTQSDDSTALCYEAPPLACADGETKVTMNAGSCCASEHSFEIIDNTTDTAVVSGAGDVYEACHVLPASWRVVLTDSYGDGWDGATLTIGDVTYGSTFYSGGTDCTNGDGTDCAPSGPALGSSCTASCYYYGYDTNGSFYYGYEDCVGVVNCSGNCSSVDQQNAWANDGWCDSIFNCEELSWDGGDCTPSLASADDDVINESIASKIALIAAEQKVHSPSSDRWMKLNEKLRLLVNENPMIHDDQSANLESFKDDNTVSDGYQLISDYRLKVASGNNPNLENVRAAAGFNIYKQDATGAWANIGSTTAGTTFQVATDPIGCYAVSAYDSSPVYESPMTDALCLESPACPITGDVTQDGLVNISDIVFLVNAILGSGLDASCADMNGDGFTNVSDVVAIVNVILNARTISSNDATDAVLLISSSSLKLESDGFIQGVQMTISHDPGFEIELSDAFVSEYKTIDNQTTLILVSDGSHSITDIATFEGDLIIESVHVVNQSGDVTVEETVELASFSVEVAGPNPFNPSTQLNIVVPEAGFVSVNVYNILGQQVATLVDGYMEATPGHMVNFNASHLASGVYLVRAITANEVSTQKLMLLK